MPKGLKKKILQTRLSSIVFWVLCLIAIIQFFASCGIYNYEHIPRELIPHELYKEVSPNIIKKKDKPDCDYESILQNTESIESWQIPKTFYDFSVAGIVNGSYVPEDCNPQFSVAILVTYRNRQKQLDVFLPYIHNFLRKQKIHYKIFLIEQQDNKKWNKGLLYNIGARHAILEKFPCIVLHDVDVLPLSAGHLYACTHGPRHASAALDKFRFVLPYNHLVGGVLLLRASQYSAINGFSNKYEGWGGEDDDFAARIQKHGLQILRFPREMSRYTMLVHPPEPKNSERSSLLSTAGSDSNDGLRVLRFDSLSIKNHQLFTQIAVKL